MIVDIVIPLSLPALCFWPRESLQSLVEKGQVRRLLSFAKDVEKRFTNVSPFCAYMSTLKYVYTSHFYTRNAFLLLVLVFL